MDEGINNEEISGEIKISGQPSQEKPLRHTQTRLYPQKLIETSGFALLFQKSWARIVDG
jgi:hypothetical protein